MELDEVEAVSASGDPGEFENGAIWRRYRFPPKLPDSNFFKAVKKRPWLLANLNRILIFVSRTDAKILKSAGVPIRTGKFAPEEKRQLLENLQKLCENFPEIAENPYKFFTLPATPAAHGTSEDPGTCAAPMTSGSSQDLATPAARGTSGDPEYCAEPVVSGSSEDPENIVAPVARGSSEDPQNCATRGIPASRRKIANQFMKPMWKNEKIAKLMTNGLPFRTGFCIGNQMIILAKKLQNERQEKRKKNSTGSEKSDDLQTEISDIQSPELNSAPKRQKIIPPNLSL